VAEAEASEARVAAVRWGERDPAETVFCGESRTAADGRTVPDFQKPHFGVHCTSQVCQWLAHRVRPSRAASARVGQPNGLKSGGNGHPGGGRPRPLMRSSSIAHTVMTEENHPRPLGPFGGGLAGQFSGGSTFLWSARTRPGGGTRRHLCRVGRGGSIFAVDGSGARGRRLLASESARRGAQESEGPTHEDQLEPAAARRAAMIRRRVDTSAGDRHRRDAAPPWPGSSTRFARAPLAETERGRGRNGWCGSQNDQTELSLYGRVHTPLPVSR